MERPEYTTVDLPGQMGEWCVNKQRAGDVEMTELSFRSRPEFFLQLLDDLFVHGCVRLRIDVCFAQVAIYKYKPAFLSSTIQKNYKMSELRSTPLPPIYFGVFWFSFSGLICVLIFFLLLKHSII